MNGTKIYDVDVDGKKIHFERNAKLKPINCVMSWTNEQVEEYIKCKNSYWYFINNYVKVLTLDNGIQPIKLRDYQEKILTDFHENRFNALLAPRQCVTGDTKIKLRYKDTMEEFEISIEDLFNSQKLLSNLS